MKVKGKTYRIFDVDGEEYSGKDGHKGRTCKYILDLFPNGWFNGKRVLDMGCAAGAMLFECNKLGMQEGVGVDADWEKRAIGEKICEKHEIDNIEFRSAGTARPLFIDVDYGKFDCVFLLNLLHHLPDPVEMLEYCCKVAKEYLCIETPDKAMYAPYGRDKHKEREKPFSVDEMIDFVYDRGFGCEGKRPSENQDSFEGGDRYVYLLRKE